MKLSTFLSWGSLIVAIGVGVAACKPAADVASENLSKKADNYEIMRRVVVIAGFTDAYLFEVVGFCALGNNDKPGQLSMTCKDASGIKKHFFFVGDNDRVLVSDMESTDVSTFHTIINFRPQTIIPDIDFQADSSQLRPQFDGGTMLNLTEDRFAYPVQPTGGGLVRLWRGINQYVATLRGAEVPGNIAG